MPHKKKDETYPVCRFGSRNCHAYANERCMALESLDPKWTRCPFYKSADQIEREEARSRKRLHALGLDHLIRTGKENDHVDQ